MGYGKINKYWNEMSKDPWNCPGKKNGVGYHALLQGIFLTQRWNQQLLNCRSNSRELLSHWESPINIYIHTYICVCVYVCMYIYKPIPPHFMLAQFGVEGSKSRKKDIFFQAHLCFSYVQLCVTPWTVALQAPLSVGFSRQEY